MWRIDIVFVQVSVVKYDDMIGNAQDSVYWLIVDAARDYFIFFVIDN